MHLHRHSSQGGGSFYRPVIHCTNTHTSSPTPTSRYAFSARILEEDDSRPPLATADPNASELGLNETGIGAFRVLIAVSVAAWIFFGASCILCINGKGKAGRWVPEWYLDSCGSRWNKALVAAWWLAVVLLWPVLLPLLLVGKLVEKVKKVVKKKQRKRRRPGDEESQSSGDEKGAIEWRKSMGGCACTTSGGG